MSKFEQIPAEACVFNAPAVEFRSNGENAKSAPFELMARSAKAIDHWYFGRVIHDFSGMKAKKRMPIDYNHDGEQIIGFANKTAINEEGLMLSGSLVSVMPGDRADIIMKQAAAGIPYEASIFFGGDGLVFEEVNDGEEVEVNGTQFAGPGVVVREWPLRGCAICPYGADANTASTIFSAAGKFSASVKPKHEKKDEPTMAEPTVPTALSAVTAPECPQAVEIAPVEAAPAAVEPEKVVEAEPAALSAAEIVSIAAEFGADIAIKVAAKKGGTYTDALKFQNDALKAELIEARKATPAPVSTPSAAPAKFADGEPAKGVRKPKRLRDAVVNIRK